MLSVAAIRNFNEWTQDISQAYIQSENFARDVYVKGHQIFNLNEGKDLKL